MTNSNKCVNHEKKGTHICPDVPPGEVRASTAILAATLPTRGVSISTTGAVRANLGKPKLSYVPRALLIGVARVMQFGAEKYAPHNWRRGMPYTETADSCMRHIQDWLNGEDWDPESGLHHLAHAACNLGFLLEYIARGRTDLDNRWTVTETGQEILHLEDQMKKTTTSQSTSSSDGQS